MAREGQPTPTQEENDRAKLGEHVLYHEYDGTGLDHGAKPIGAPDPEIPERPPIDPDNPPYVDNTLPETPPVEPPVEPPEEPAPAPQPFPFLPRT